MVYDPGEEENTESSFIPRTLAIQDESCEGLRNSKLTQYSFWSIGSICKEIGLTKKDLSW